MNRDYRPWTEVTLEEKVKAKKSFYENFERNREKINEIDEKIAKLEEERHELCYPDDNWFSKYDQDGTECFCWRYGDHPEEFICILDEYDIYHR